MSYNLKNKTVVMFALALSLAFANSVKAEEAKVADITPPVAVDEQPVNNEQLAKNEQKVENEQPAMPSEDDPFGLDDPLAASEENISATADVQPAVESREVPMPANRDLRQPQPLPELNNNAPKAEMNVQETNQPSVPDVNFDEGLADVSIDSAAPKTPFEKYGNAILSRVDNELFNQMSEIEKQTTLLNLELKREEVKNRIDALKAQRERAKQEELDREAEREKQARDEELQRQKALLQEQMRLKEKEMELEKIRQAKIISDYMNELLVTNQKWVETNAKLSLQVRTLQEERKNLIDEIENKLEGLNKRATLTGQLAEESRVAFERKVSSLNKQIENLKQVISEKDEALKNMAKGNGGDNPFAGSAELIDEDAVDMSKEYAIMDITGKGDNIVAKIVSQDGTTFTVRKGSVLKGGEVVVSISDKFITFENKGKRSYLYTGGTVMQYEPTETFNDATKTPEIAIGSVVNNPEIRNVRGAGNNNRAAPNLKDTINNAVQNAPTNTDMPTGNNASVSVNNSAANAAKTPNKGVASFSKGMMVK